MTLTITDRVQKEARIGLKQLDRRFLASPLQNHKYTSS
jgi:hypothetical protein